MREVWILQMKTRRARTWWPAEVLATKKGAETARAFQQEKYPRLMFRVRKFTEAKGQ